MYVCVCAHLSVHAGAHEASGVRVEVIGGYELPGVGAGNQPGSSAGAASALYH